MAKRMNTHIDVVAEQERADRDLTLTTLYQWQSVLQVPLSELLVEPEDSLTPEVKRRALMIRIMKTAKVVLEHAHQSRLRRTAQMLVDQLTELMPELHEIQPWNEVGQRRTSKDLGAAFYRGVGLQNVLGQCAPEP
jgi:transcriptional regulator with XRE-family HTH domain